MKLSIPDIIGTPYGGGRYAGRYLLDDRLCILIASDHLGDFEPRIWNKSLKRVDGALHFADGMSNTRAMAEAGSKLAEAILALEIGGERDWCLPARDQLELLYRHFKPTAYENYVHRNGDNPSSVPPGYPYTEKLPGVTEIEGFGPGGADAFKDTAYWSSTQRAAFSEYAWYQYFGYGGQGGYRKGYGLRARAVRSLFI